MHKKHLKAYSREGLIADDKDFIRLRAEHERLLIQEMRDDGYLPARDVKILWSTRRLDNSYEFIITMYAAFAGKRKSQEYDCWDENGHLAKY